MAEAGVGGGVTSPASSQTTTSTGDGAQMPAGLERKLEPEDLSPEAGEERLPEGVLLLLKLKTDPSESLASPSGTSLSPSSDPWSVGPGDWGLDCALAAATDRCSLLSADPRSAGGQHAINI